MKRSTAKRRLKRGIAYLLTLALVFSMFSGMGFTSMASEAGLISGQNEDSGYQNAAEDGDFGSLEETEKESGDASGDKQEAVSQEKTEAQDGEDGSEAASTSDKNASETETASQENGKDNEPEESGSEPEDGSEEVGTESESESEAETVIETESETETETEAETRKETVKRAVRTAAAVSDASYVGSATSSSLTIRQSEMEEAGQRFDGSGMAELIAAGAYQEGQFQQIRIIADNMTDPVIQADIFNALRPCLDMNSSDGPALLSWLFSESDYDVKWEFQKPQKDMDSDLTMNLDVSVKNGAVYVSVSDASAFSGKVEWAGARIILKSASEMKTKLADALGPANHLHLKLYEGDAEEPVYNASGFWYKDGENSNLETLQIGSVQNLSSSAVYRLAAYDYSGDVEQNGNGKKLYIDQDSLEMSGRSYDAEGIASLLDKYSEDEFDEIWMAARVFDKTISPDIYNAFIPYLNSSNENRTLTFSFYNGPTDGGYLIVQSFIRPHASSADAISTDAKLTVENNVITFSLPHASDLTGWADSNRMQFLVEDGTRWRDDLRSVLGSSPTTISVYDAAGESALREHGGNWDTDGTGKYWLNIFEIQELDANTDYTVRRYDEEEQERGWRLEWEFNQPEDRYNYEKYCADEAAVVEAIGQLKTDYPGTEISIGSINGECDGYIPGEFLQAYAEIGTEFRFTFRTADDVWYDWYFSGLDADAQYSDYPVDAITVSQGTADSMTEAAFGNAPFIRVSGISDVSAVHCTSGYIVATLLEEFGISPTPDGYGGGYIYQYIEADGGSLKQHGAVRADLDEKNHWFQVKLVEGVSDYWFTSGKTYAGSDKTYEEPNVHRELVLDEYIAREAYGSDGFHFTDEYLLELLRIYYSGESFNAIHVLYANDTAEEEPQISAELWNGLRSYLITNPDDWPQFEIGRGSSKSSYDFNYYFIVPEEVTEAVTLFMPAVDMENRTLTFSRTQYPVGKMAGLAFSSDEIAALYDNMTRIDLTDGSGAVATTANIRDGRVCDLFIQDLAADKPYHFASNGYTGSAFEGPGGAILTLNEGSARKAYGDDTFSFTDEYLLELLSDNYAGQTFDIINIQYAPDSAPNGLEVSAELWNGVMGYQKSAKSTVEYAVVDGTAEVTNFVFNDLETMASGSILLAADLNVDNKTVRFAQTQFPAVYLTVVLRSAGFAGMFSGRCDIELLEGTETASTGFYALDSAAGAGELTLGDVQNLTADTVYTIKAAETAYVGTVSTGNNGRKTLTLMASEAQKAGVAEFTEAYILGLLQAHYAGIRFEDIRIMNDTWGTNEALNVTAGFWNELLSWLEQDGDTRFVFQVGGAEGDFEYWIQNPKTAADDMRMGLAADGVNRTITPEQVQFPAERLERIAFWPKDENIIAWYGNSRKIYLMRGNAVDATGHFIVAPDGSVMLNISDILELEDGRTYTVSDLGYIGSVDEWERGRTLHISQSLLEKSGKSFDLESIEELLANYEQGSFYQVDVGLSPSETSILAGEIYNALLPYLDSALEGRQIGYIFDSNEYSVIWHFINPTAITGDRTMDVSMSAADGELRMSFSSAVSLADSAENVQMSYWVNKGDANGMYKVLETLGERDLEIRETATGSAAQNHAVIYGNTDIGGFGVSVDHVETLQENTGYTLCNTEYRGSVTEEQGRRELCIDKFAMENAGFEFNADEVRKILETYYAEKRFDGIIFEQSRKESPVINADIFNTALLWLKDSGDSWLKYCFRDEYNEMIGSYTLIQPAPMDADIRVGYEWTVAVKDAVLKINFFDTPEKIQAYAQDVVWTLSPVKNPVADEYPEYIQALYNVLLANMSDYGNVALYEDESEKLAAAAETSIYGNDDVGMMEIRISHLQNLKPDTYYRVGKWSYCGEVSEQEEYALYISQEDMVNDGQTFDGEGIAKLLSSYEKGSFDLIGIFADDAVISKDVYNAVAPYLKSDYERARIDYSFDKDDYDCSVIWTFGHPTAALEQDDVSVEATLEAKDGNIEVSLASTEVFLECASGVSMNFELKKDSALCSSVSSVLGNESRELSLFAPDSQDVVENVGAGWNVDEDYDRLHIYDLQNLAENTVYAVGEYTYRGRTWTGGDGTRNLWISSFGFDGTEKLEKSQLESVINWYAEQGENFNQIYIEERYTETGKTIQKDYVNLALQILDDQYDPSEDAMGRWNRLTFVYSNDQEEGEDKLYWHFLNPNAITANISADVTLTATENGGVTYKLSSKQASLQSAAQSVSFEFGVSSNMDRAGQIVTGLGTIDVNESCTLLTLKSGTAYVDTVHPYYGNGYGTLWLGVSCVQWCAANTAYVLLRPAEVENTYNVGDVAALGSGDFSLSQTPGGTVTWKTTDAGVAYVSSNAKTKTSELWIVDGGETYVWASYKVGSTSSLEAFHVHTTNDITGISFDSAELTMNLNYIGGVKENGYEDCRAFLNIKFSPSSSGCSTDYYPAAESRNEIKWGSNDENENVVKFVVHEDDSGNTYINGEIEAVGPGTAVITATYLNGSENTDAAMKAVCTITVLPAIAMDEMEWPDPYALVGVEKTLADVDLPDGWEWEAPDTDLTKFAGTDGHSFEANYTWKDDGSQKERKQTFTIYVRMVSLGGIGIGKVTGDPDSVWDVEDMPAALEKDSKIELWWGVLLNNTAENDNYDEFLANLRAVWTTKLGTIFDPEYDSDGNNRERIRSYASAKAGKDTIGVTIYYGDPANGGIKLGSETVSLNIAASEPFDFESDVYGCEWKADYSYVNAKGKEVVEPSLFLCVNAEAYDRLGTKKLAFTSGDTSILTLGKQTVYTGEAAAEIVGEVFAEHGIGDEKAVVVRVPYTVKGKGTAAVTVTAYGSVNSTTTYSLKVDDPTPKLSATSLTINRALSDASAQITAFSDIAYPIEEIRLGEGIADFELNCTFVNSFEKIIEDETKTVSTQADVTISLSENAEVKKGSSYKVPVLIKTAAGETTFTITIKITETLPAFTVKQTKKVNLFYKDEEGDGELTVTAKNAVITDLWLEGNDYYELEQNYAGGWNIKFKSEDGSSAEANKLSKKGTLYCTLEGYEGTVKVKELTISAAITKPSIVQSAKTDTLYTKLAYETSKLALTDKATGEALDIASALYMANKVGTEIIAESAGTFKPQYNTFNVLYEGDGVLSFTVTETDSKTRTDKFSLQVKEENWRDYLTVSYSVKTDVTTAAPKVKLGSSTITLNAADEIYAYQQVKIPVTLNGSAGLLDEDTYVWFTGNDAKSIQALKMDDKLVLQYWGGDESSVVARVNDSGFAAGTYKYTVWVANDTYGYKASAALTVKVVNKAAAKCLTVSAKGTIDVLDRSGTSVAYTPKLSNLAGTVTDGWLEGRDAYMFDAAFNSADGKLYVYAKEGFEYVTGYAYQVMPVFWVQPVDCSGYELNNGKVLTIKVKQGKPKVTASAVTNTLYRSSGNGIQINISAVLGTKQVTIDSVELLNYTNDLYLEEYEVYYPDENGELQTDATTWEPESGYILLKAKKEPAEILKTGKTWSVKLSIHYMDQAGNEKDTQTTCKVVVR